MTHEELVEAVALFCAGSTAGGQRMRAEKVLAIAAAALKEPTEEMVAASSTVAGLYETEFSDDEYKVFFDGCQIGGASDEELAEMLMLDMMERHMIRAAISVSPLFPKKDKADA